MIVALGGIACGVPGGARQQSEKPPREPAAQRALTDCLERENQPDAAKAREAAEIGLRHGVLDDRLRTQLIACRARAAAARHDTDAPELLKAAIRTWERTFGVDEELARLTHELGMYHALGGDLPQAEQNLRRGLALREKLPGAPHVARSLFGLFDVLDQACRTDEATALLERFEQLYPSDPGYPQWYPGLPEVFQSTLARRRGDIARARTLLARVPPQLQGAELERHYATHVHEVLADYSREAADYAEALRLREIAERANRATGVFELALAHRAANSARLGDYERRHVLTYVAAGGALFPSRLPALEACTPATGPEARGWLFDMQGSEAIDTCVARATHPPNAKLFLLIRIEQGRVVATGVVGKSFETAVLECVAKSALSLAYPAPHHFNFRSDLYEHEAPP